MAAWIIDAVRDAGIDPGGINPRIQAEPLGAGYGMFGTLLRLRLRFAAPAAGAPESLILKMPATGATNRSRATAFDMYGRESRFYREVAPALRLRTPRCYWSGTDPGSGQPALLLEDLGAMHAEDQLAGCAPRRAAHAVTQLAVAHAQWWEAAELDRLAWMPSLASRVTMQLAPIARRQWAAFAELYGDLLPAGFQAIGERLSDDLDRALHQLSTHPATVIHGDFRVDNLFFDDRSAGRDVVVADWQLTCRARGVFDVAYLLCQSLAVADRRRVEHAILRSWHRSLVARGVTRYSFADAIADYRISSLVCVAYAVAGAVLDRLNDRGSALARVQAERTVAAALDLLPFPG